MMGRPLKDRTGQSYGRLVVIGGPRRSGKSILWRCRCECGRECDAYSGSLEVGRTVSCGCWRSERTSAASTTHGRTRTPEYKVYHQMLKRCYRETCRDYPRYGGRGIRVCERWLGAGGFERFFADMGERPSDDHSIERREVNGDYAPGNCTWATKKEQANNRRSSRFITWAGETMTLAQWADRSGIQSSTISNRLRLGWSMESALNTPTETTHV